MIQSFLESIYLRSLTAFSAISKPDDHRCQNSINSTTDTKLVACAKVVFHSRWLFGLFCPGIREDKAWCPLPGQPIVSVCHQWVDHVWKATLCDTHLVALPELSSMWPDIVGWEYSNSLETSLSPRIYHVDFSISTSAWLVCPSWLLPASACLAAWLARGQQHHGCRVVQGKMHAKGTSWHELLRESMSWTCRTAWQRWRVVLTWPSLQESAFRHGTVQC